MEKQRTHSQNNSIHLYLEMVAHELQNQGQTMENVIKALPTLEIPPTKNALKEIVWKPIQDVTLGKKSTTELETADVNKVYEVFSMFLSKNFQIDIPFPSNEINSFEQYL